MVAIAVSLLVFSVATLVTAQIPSLGWCPEYLPMADFDMGRYLGKWYEAERYFTFSELASRCVTTDYARVAGGKIQLSNEITNRLTGVKRVIGGNLEVVGRDGEGKLHIKLATLPVATETTLNVLDTDYENYAVVWSCSGIGPLHTENAWVMTRDRLPSGSVLQKAYGVLDKFKISRTFFVKTDQEGCAVAASEINAANGVSGISTLHEQNEAGRNNLPIKEKVPDTPEFENSVKHPEPVAAAIIKSEVPSVQEKPIEPILLVGAAASAIPSVVDLKSEPYVPIEPVPAKVAVETKPKKTLKPEAVVSGVVSAPLEGSVIIPVSVPLPVATNLPEGSEIRVGEKENVADIKKPISVAEHILSKVEAPVPAVAAVSEPIVPFVEQLIVEKPTPVDVKPVEAELKHSNKAQGVREAHKKVKA